MKTIIRLMLIGMCSVWSVSAFAQSYTYPTVDINGIEVNKEYSKQQVVAAWGEPDKYYHQEDPEDGKTERYHYNNSQMIFSNGCLTYFYIEDPGFRVFTSKRNGRGIQVGDIIASLLEDIPLTLDPGQVEPIPGDRDVVEYYTVYLGQSDDIVKVKTYPRAIVYCITYTGGY